MEHSGVYRPSVQTKAPKMFTKSEPVSTKKFSCSNPVEKNKTNKFNYMSKSYMTSINNA